MIVIFLAYYEPFLAAIDFGGVEELASESSEFIFASLPQAGMRVGILRGIADRVRAASLGEISGLAESIKSQLEQHRGFAAFLDGTVVETDWEASLIMNDWDAAQQ